MKEVARWLVDIEERASRLYEKAMLKFLSDRDIADFLRLLSDDEKEHHDIMRNACEITEKSGVSSLLYLDNGTRREVEGRFLSVEKKLDEGGLSRDNLMDFIIEAEYSELNQLFLSVVNTLMHCHREFIPGAVKIQRHKGNIVRFLQSHDEFGKYLEKIRQLPDVWRERFLVVDDDELIADALKAVLEGEGLVESAPNGREALRKIGEKYYGAIIVDIEMPVMDGIEFYRRAVEVFPDIKDRLLFFIGTPRTEDLSFLKEHGLRYLGKPSQIRDIKKVIAEIVNR